MQTETHPELLSHPASLAAPAPVARSVARPVAPSDEKLASPKVRYVMVGLLLVSVVAATAFAVARQQIDDPTTKPLTNNGQTVQGDPVQLNRLHEAVKANPNDFDTRMSLGDYYYQTGDYAAAVSAYKEALQQRPTDLAGQEALGNAYLRVGDFPSATTAFRVVYTADPNRAAAAIALCIALVEQGGTQRAEGQTLWMKIRSMPGMTADSANQNLVQYMDQRLGINTTPKP